MKRIGLYVLIYLAAASFAWGLRDSGIQSGDYVEYSETVRYGMKKPFFHIREPGAVALWQAFAWGTRAVRADEDTPPIGLTPEERIIGFGLLGAFSAGWFAVFAAAFLLEFSIGPNPRTFLAVAVLAVSSITWTFVGHIEFYAPYYAALMGFYWTVARYARRRSPANLILLLAGAWLALFMHRAALFHLPGLLIFWLRPASKFRLRKPSEEERLPLLLFVIFVCFSHTIPIASAMFGAPLLVFEDYNWLPELLTPFTQGWADYVVENSKLGSSHLFTFGSLDHAKHFFFFVLISAPLGAPIALASFRRVGDSGRPDRRAFALAAASVWVWALFWHPHLGYGDWDLFSQGGLPTNLLAVACLLELRAPD